MIIIVFLLIIISIFAVLCKKERLIVFLICFSITTDLFIINVFGPTMQIYQFLGLLLLPQSINFIIKIIKKSSPVRLIIFWFILLVLLGLIFGYIFPWEYLTSTRLWNQRAQGRAFIQIIKYLSLLSLALYLAKVSKQKEIITWGLKGFYLGIVINVAFALIDYAGGREFIALFINNRALSKIGNRSIGFCSEPRFFGQICALGFLINLLFINYSLFTRFFMMLIGIVGMFFAASASAFISLTITMMALIIKNILNRKSIKLLIVTSILFILFAITINYNLFSIKEQVIRRIESRIVVMDQEYTESIWIARLEVFDRAALRFLMANPQYILFGVGPNLISIPASRHIPSIASRVYGETINSAPNTGIVNIICSTGLVGLFLWTITILLIYRKLNRKNNSIEPNFREILFAISIFYLTNTTVVFFAILGFSIGIYSNSLNLKGEE